MLPEAFLDRMRAQLGEEYAAFLASFDRPRATALRVNPGKGAPPALPFAREPVPWEEYGFYCDSAARPGLHPWHEAGVYYLQEASAMAPVQLLDPRAGEAVCDLCAAPGGKSTQIAARMHGQGILVCNEISPKRARILSRNIERLGVANALVCSAHPALLAQELAGCFDRVLVDAPCSGEGMFRKEEAAVTDWSEATVAMCAARQREILGSAAQLLKPGGRLVYSTCTFSPEEDEQTVAQFLSDHPEFSPETVAAPWFTPTEPGCWRLWPHKLLGEGHFAAVLRKNDGREGLYPTRAGEKMPKELAEFLAQAGIVLPAGELRSLGQRLFLAPPACPDLPGRAVLRAGLELGECRKGRFEPAHALALWLREAGSSVELPPDGDEIRRYLRGETLPAARRGWQLVTTGGYSIGWAKGDGSALKNHYPKGLRRNEISSLHANVFVL
ncbi:MAG: RsmB/NOP family class I SAM-dependent RNA methyltransferase [Firmicutes bacterium]|nr:RsmB/NOP family class I SAM-dependent RNA methyltransferase [Bacillota bacterium]